MSENGPLGSSYVKAADAFSNGDAFGTLLAENVVFDASGQRVGNSAAEIVSALKKLREALGWQTHEVMSTDDAGNVMTVIAKNTFADGSWYYVAGCAMFEDGKITHMGSAGPVRL